MNIERAEMRIKLDEKREAEAKMRRDIDGLCRNIRKELNIALTPVEDLRLPLVSQLMDELMMAWGELQAARSDIARLEYELR